MAHPKAYPTTHSRAYPRAHPRAHSLTHFWAAGCSTSNAALISDEAEDSAET